MFRVGDREVQGCKTHDQTRSTE